jgi:2-C-methyl-D-erythritol 4-phosphate cytidylyltransferase
MPADPAAILPLPTCYADDSGAVFTAVAGRPSLARVVATMPGAAVVAVAAPIVGAVRDTLAAQGLSSAAVVAADNPGTRAQCLAAGLAYLDGLAPAILIYDIRRPLTPAALRDRAIDALRAGASIVLPVSAVTDSVKAVDARGAVTATVERSTLRAVQYPRGFAVDELVRLLAGRASEDFDELDEALRIGAPLTVVEGDPDGFAVELPRDSAFVEAIIACRDGDPARIELP